MGSAVVGSPGHIFCVERKSNPCLECMWTYRLWQVAWQASPGLWRHMHRHRSDKVLRSLYQMLMLTESIHPERELNNQIEKITQQLMSASITGHPRLRKKKKDKYTRTYV